MMAGQNDSDEDIQDVMNEDISRAPQDPELLAERLRDNTSSSPADSGGDIDANWEEVNTTGSESVFGDNPTPDQSDVEENAHAMGINFEDSEPLDFLGKMEERDRHRFELDEDSEGPDGTI
mgnify:CR=1 FL=1